MRQPCQKRLLAATGMVKAFHREQFALHGVMRLIQKRAGCWHLRVFEDGMPARFLLLKPTPYTLTVGRPRRGGFPGENAKFLALEVGRGQSHKFNRTIVLLNIRASTH